jgi:hypothetical protein
VLALVAAALIAGAAPARITPVQAVSIPSKHATQYQVAPVGTQPGRIVYDWTLQLVRVDRAAGKIDPRCTNSKFGAAEEPGNLVFMWSNVGNRFVWYHGECNHRDVGPSGHQGTVTVVAKGRGWTCTAWFGGTEAREGPPPTCQRNQAAPTGPLTPPLADRSAGFGAALWGGIAGAFALGAAALGWMLLSRPRAVLTAAPAVPAAPEAPAGPTPEQEAEQARSTVPPGWTIERHNGANWTATDVTNQVAAFHSTAGGYRWLNATTGEYLT